MNLLMERERTVIKKPDKKRNDGDKKGPIKDDFYRAGIVMITYLLNA